MIYQNKIYLGDFKIKLFWYQKKVFHLIPLCPYDSDDLSLYSYGLGQISWKINIISSENCKVESQELKGDNTQDSLQTVH